MITCYCIIVLILSVKHIIVGTFQLRNNIDPESVITTLDCALETGYRLIGKFIERCT